jgi:DNA-binding NtrC family response regulator
VAINCAAIPENLLESELFGHEKGAFTGAVKTTEGKIEQASGGTLFLDEVGDIPFALQVKLLRFLQEHEYRAVGSNTVRLADVRVVAASNRPLRELAQQGAFREDLYYRLNVLSLSLPPLRERAADIPLLAAHFLQRYGGAAHTLAACAQARLMAHRWPGNVRELAHVVERAALLARSPCLRQGDIEIDGEAPCAAPNEAEEPGSAESSSTLTAPAAGLSLRDAKARLVQDFERRYIEDLLSRHAGNVTHAASEAGKNRRAFFELMRRYRIESSSFRAPH